MIINVQNIKCKLIIISTLFFLSACDKTDKIDITEHEWELMEVESDGKKKEKPDEDFNKPYVYILRFENDTMFRLDTDENTAGGNYEIPKKGKIRISNYHNWSAVGSSNSDFNDKLFKVFNEVNSYEVKKGFRMTLTFEGPKGEVKFKEK